MEDLRYDYSNIRMPTILWLGPLLCVTAVSALVLRNLHNLAASEGRFILLSSVGLFTVLTLRTIAHCRRYAATCRRIRHLSADLPSDELRRKLEEASRVVQLQTSELHAAISLVEHSREKLQRLNDMLAFAGEHQVVAKRDYEAAVAAQDKVARDCLDAATAKAVKVVDARARLDDGLKEHAAGKLLFEKVIESADLALQRYGNALRRP